MKEGSSPSGESAAVNARIAMPGTMGTTWYFARSYLPCRKGLLPLSE